MFKKLFLVIAVVMASSLSFAGEYIGARIIPVKAEKVKISDFVIHEDWNQPAVVVRYELKRGGSDDEDTRRYKLYFKVDSDLLSNSDLKKIEEDSGWFSSRSKQKRIAKRLFQLLEERGLTGRVLLLELK